MFEIQFGDSGEVILSGRFDASHVEKAERFFCKIQESRTVDFSKLAYISSAGLGVLLATQKRLQGLGSAIKLAHANSHIRDIFRYSGFDQIFEIE